MGTSHSQVFNQNYYKVRIFLREKSGIYLYLNAFDFISNKDKVFGSY